MISLRVGVFRLSALLIPGGRGQLRERKANAAYPELTRICTESQGHNSLEKNRIKRKGGIA